MKEEIQKQIETLKNLVKLKRNAAETHWCWCVKDRLQQEATDLEKQADELENENKD